MFFVCHSKLKWKQDCVWCQQKRMSNADVEVFFLILHLNCCFSVAPSSRGNVRKNLLLLCFQPMVATRNGVVNMTGFTVQDTRFSSTVSCTKKCIVCWTNAEQMQDKSLKRDFCFLLPLYTKILQDKCYINTYRETSTVATTVDFSFCQHKQNHKFSF